MDFSERALIMIMIKIIQVVIARGLPTREIGPEA